MTISKVDNADHRYSPLLALDQTIDEINEQGLVNDTTKHAAAHAAMGFNTYCQQAGVTGINDGSRDDAPLLQAAYAAAVAAGANALVLPVGDIYIKSYTDDTVSYPYSYVIRVTAAVTDFVIYVPAGCRIFVTPTAAPTQPSSGIGLFQFIGNRSKLVFDGYAEHTTPPTSATPTNYWHVAHLTSGCDGGVITGRGTAKGFANPYVGVFDNSSTTVGTIKYVSVRDCILGAVQSSGGATVSSEITGVRVKNAWTTGVSCAGAVNKVSDIIVDNRDITQTGSPSLLAITGPIEQCNIQDIQLFGSPAGVGQGLYISPTNQSNKSSVQVTNYTITNSSLGVRLEGVARLPKFYNGHFNNVGYGFYKNAGQVNNGDTFINGVTFAACSYGFRNTNTSQGNLYLANVAASQAFLAGMFFAGSGACVINPINVSPIVPIANRADMQRKR